MDYSKYTLGAPSSMSASIDGTTTETAAPSLWGDIIGGITDVYDTTAYLLTAEEQAEIASASARAAEAQARSDEAEASTSLSAYASANPTTVLVGIAGLLAIAYLALKR